jgi:hypothetical protein
MRFLAVLVIFSTFIWSRNYPHPNAPNPPQPPQNRGVSGVLLVSASR